MFKTKVLNKHLALALTSGLLLMTNAVNAEPYIGSITPDNEILRGNNVVVTQDTTGDPVFFTPSTYVVGDGSGTLTVNTNDTLGSVIFRAPDNNDQVGEGLNLKGNLVLNLNLKPRYHETGQNSAIFGGADKPWMSVNIDGNFELNATFNSNGIEVTKTDIPYFQSARGQSSFSVTGDVKISVVTIASDAKVNASTQAFTFNTEASSSEEAKKTVNVGNPNSTFSLFTAYFKNPDNYDKADTMAGANGVYAFGSTDINIKAGKKVQIISVADYADAISAKEGGRVDLGSPEMLQVIGVVDFFTGDNTGAATQTSRQSRISGTFQGNNSFWFGDEKVKYTDKNSHGQHGGDLNFTFKDGAEWIYMVNPRLTKITLEDGGAVNMYDDYVLKLWQEKVVDPKTDLKLPEQASLADFWPSVIKDGQLAFKHQIVVLDKLNGNNGIFRMDFDSYDKKKTDLIFVGDTDNKTLGEFNIQAHPEDPEDLVNSFGNVSDDNPLLFAYVAKPAADKITFKDYPNIYNHKLYDYYAKIETRTYEEMKDKLAEYDTNYKVLDPKTSKFHEHDALGLYGNQEEGIYWVITNLVRSESNELKSLYASGESGWGYATYLDRLSKRMGEIQYQEGSEGLWIRGRYSRLGKSSYDMKWGGVQFGGDYKNTERNRIGVALAFDNGKADFNHVDGKNDLHGFNLMAYDTWRHEDGWYLDATARYGKFHNKSHVKTITERVSSNYRQSIFSLGLEGGKRIILNEEGGFFLEPQAQIQWASVGKASWKTSNDIQAKIKRGNSFIGRLGTQLGKEWIDSKNRKNNAYVKADVLHEFGNGQKAEFSADGITASRKWGAKGTWYDAGVSGQFALGKQSWAHIDLEKQFGGGLKNSWQINANIRWNF